MDLADGTQFNGYRFLGGGHIFAPHKTCLKQENLDTTGVETVICGGYKTKASKLCRDLEQLPKSRQDRGLATVLSKSRCSK